MSNRMLSQRAGGGCTCEQCKVRKDCNRCSMCTMRQLAGSRSNMLPCYQKMCCNIPIHGKAQTGDGFLPKNWMFFFDVTRKNPNAKGLFIFKKGGDPKLRCRSFEEAATCYPADFVGFKEKTTDFYGEVGLTNVKPPSPPFSPPSATQTRRRGETPSNDENDNNDEVVEVGARRLVCNDDDDDMLEDQFSCFSSIEPAPDNNDDNSNSNKKNIESMAKNLDTGPVEKKPPKKKQRNSNHNNNTTLNNSKNHYHRQHELSLLGRDLVSKWINIDGQCLTVVGTIVKVDHTLCTVEFGSLQEKFNADVVSSGRLRKRTQIKHDVAWGHCLEWEAMMMIPSSSPPPGNSRKPLANPYITWLVPRVYNRSMGVPENGTSLPCVTLLHKNFVLEFVVKASNIPNAGLGVFLSCHPSDVPAGDGNNNNNTLPTTAAANRFFELPAGHLLDFGVYAPIRPDDRRDNYYFVLKNFIHNFKCEGYSFETSDDDVGDTIFDITDDVTGELHEDAKLQVPPFVNEISSSNGVAQVHAEYDCEGALHYLLGHDHHDQGPFRVEVGKEIEILVDYGDSYENFRLRQGYPRKKVNPVKARLQLRKDELEYLRNVDEYTLEQIGNLKPFFLRLLERKESLRPEVAARILLVLLLLRKRNQKIIDDNNNSSRDTTDLPQTSAAIIETLISRVVRIWRNVDNLYAQLWEDEVYAEFMKEFFPGVELESILSYKCG